RIGPVGRSIKWVRRRPALAASSGCVLLAIGVSLLFAYIAHRAKLKLLDEKISKAYLVAFSGDLDQTDEAIKEIEELGGSTGQVYLLKGMVYHFRGEVERSLDHLERAVEMDPDSVAAKGMLAMACLSVGDHARYDRMTTELEAIAPHTAEDYLFK